MIGWSPDGLTMTPDGQLFAADRLPRSRTHELTPELEIIRSFEHPFEDELDFGPATPGVAFNSDTGTLWWLNVEETGDELRRVLLIEGDLNGVPTGDRIELPLLGGDPPEAIYPDALSYDTATVRYYVGDVLAGTVWAFDTLGTPAAGYPIRPDAYPEVALRGPDAHGGLGSGGTPGEPEAVRLEIAVLPPGGGQFDRLIVTDPLGRDLSIETPLPDVSGGSGFGSITGNPLRSRLDPNGLLYFAFVNLATDGIVGIRPHPLPPSWLALSAWDGTLAPGESVEIALTFLSGTRAVGSTYTAALQVFEAATGTAVEVPIAFAVVPETDSEDNVEPASEASLSVYPNPATGRATVTVLLAKRTDLRVEVFDVLGRRVTVLHAGPLTAGMNEFIVDERSLPAGIYLVRVAGDAFAASRRFTVVH